MSAIAFAALLASALAAATPATAANQAESQPQDASLHYVSPFSSLAGIPYGITSVDNQALNLDQRVNARIASGHRTVSYSCPNEAGISRLSFDFKSGQTYELVCRLGQQAEIRTAGC